MAINSSYGGIMLKRIIIVAAAAVLASPATAQEGPGTKFRGLYINMAKADFELAGPPSGMSMEVAEDNADGLSYRLKKGETLCGVVDFGKNRQRIAALTLAQCYFEAAGMEFARFTRALTDNYGLKQVSCRPDPSSPARAVCEGGASTGERIHISSSGLIVSRTEVQKSPESVVGKFD
jgi:hypothetical protein